MQRSPCSPWEDSRCDDRLMTVASLYLEGMEDGLGLATGRLLLVERQPLVARTASLELEHCCAWSPGVDIGTTTAVGVTFEGGSSR